MKVRAGCSGAIAKDCRTTSFLPLIPIGLTLMVRQ